MPSIVSSLSLSFDKATFQVLTLARVFFKPSLSPAALTKNEKIGIIPTPMAENVTTDHENP